MKTLESKVVTYPSSPPLLTSLASTFLSHTYLGIVALAINIITARILGPEGKGAYALTLNFLMVLTIVAGLGFAQANVYFIGNGVSVRKIVANSFFLALTSGAGVATLVYFLAPTISKQLSGMPVAYLRIACAILPFQMFLFFCLRVFLGQGRVRTFNFIRNLQFTLQISLLMLLLVINRLTAKGAILSVFGSVLLTLAITLWLIRASLSIKADLKKFKSQLAYGIKAAFGQLAHFLNYRLDMFLVAYFLDLQAVGLYAISVAVTQAVNTLQTSSSTVLFSTSATSSAAKMDTLTPRACRTMFASLTVGAIILFLLSPYIIGIVGGAPYQPAVLPLRLLLPGMVAFGIHGILYSDLAGRGRPEIGTLASTIALIGTLVLDIILIPKWGIIGAAFASSLAYISGAIIILTSFIRLTKNPLKDMLLPRWSDVEALRKSITQSLVLKLRRSD